MLHRNLGLKATAFALAVVLWAWVLVNERNPVVTRPFQVPVSVQSCPAHLAVQYPPEGVQVTVRGQKQDLASLGTRLRAVVSAEGCRAGSHTLKVAVGAPEDVTVVSVRPETVTVSLERVISETHPVETKLVGELPSGDQFLSAEVAPRAVRVLGPTSKVKSVFRVVAPLDLVRAVPTIPMSVPVTAVDTAGARVEGVTLRPQQVSLRVQTKHEVVARTLPVLVRTAGELPAGRQLASIQVVPPFVSVVGPEASVKDLSYVRTVELRLEELTGDTTRTLALVAPEGADLLMSGSVTVSVKVTSGQQ